MKTLNIYTDGSCLGNPGPGGWGYVLEWGNYREFGGDGIADTTNQRAELIAVISALDSVNRDVPINIVTDSKYIVKGMTEWIAKWRTNGWRNTKGEPIKNVDLWKRLDQLVSKFSSVKFTWVKGHGDSEWQDYAHDLAQGAANLYREEEPGCRLAASRRPLSGF